MVRLFFLPISVPKDLISYFIFLSPLFSFSGFLLTFTGSICPNKKELKGSTWLWQRDGKEAPPSDVVLIVEVLTGGLSRVLFCKGSLSLGLIKMCYQGPRLIIQRR